MAVLLGKSELPVYTRLPVVVGGRVERTFRKINK